MSRLLIISMLVSIFLAGCSPVGDTPGAQPTDLLPDEPVGGQTPTPTAGMATDAPQPDDGNLVRGPVFIDSATIRAAESYPVQYAVVLEGNLPTPCHQLRAEVNLPDAHNVIRIELYSLVDPEVLCAQVLQDFETTLNLPDGLAAGEYTLSINEDLVLDLKIE
ncbi:MAG: hypothetical protein HPY76_14150 [Anaerolineae bacterium]|nr:hypothetical protein [Anaerolineae bacterium]